MSETGGNIDSREEFKPTPAGQYKYWNEELTASKKMLNSFHRQGTEVVQRFLGGNVRREDDNFSSNIFRLNLFHSNITTLQSLMYSNLPSVTVMRANNDPKDDVGRVAANILERILTNDIQCNGEEYDTVLRADLQDRLIPGLGCSKVRYNCEVCEDEMGMEYVEDETAPVEYVHWQDVCWGWSRTFKDIPWIGFRSYMKKDEVISRWGEDVAKALEYKKQTATDPQEDIEMDGDDGPWQVAEIWEIWDRTKKQIVWYTKGYSKVLETKEDFLGLSGFFPCAPFLLANCTTTLYLPRSDFHMAQDLYNEIDELQTRISVITQAVKVVGVYDAGSDEVGRMFEEGMDNDLIPVEKWAMLSEKGGLQGVIDWFPIRDVVETLGRLREVRDETIGLLQQVTGMSDIMRGELSGQYEGVGQSQMKAKFGSIRVQAMQDQFAKFVTDLMQIKGELICKHFEIERMAQLANVESMNDDPEMIMEGLMMLKNWDQSKLRIEIKPESVAMVDFSQKQAERTQFLDTMSKYLQMSAPMMEAQPESTPFLLQMLQWGLAGFKGSKDIEGVLDKAIMQAEQKQAEDQQNPQPDPEQQKAEMEMQKVQATMQLEQFKAQSAMQLEQLKSQNKQIEIQGETQRDMMTTQAAVEADLAKISADMQADIQQIVTKAQVEMETEQVTSEINAQQQVAAVMAEIEKLGVQTALKIQEINAAKRGDSESE